MRVVDLAKPHRNNFAAILGMATWDVGVTATARATLAGKRRPRRDAAHVQRRGVPWRDLQRRRSRPAPRPSTSCQRTGSEDVPQDATTFNFTVFCTASGNASATSTRTASSDLINGQGANTVIYLDDTIAPLNAGEHATLFDGRPRGEGRT